ncbi:DUF2027 domain-containing protein [Prolixibacter sp. SD074]|jgi:hypothetical protein|uniref:Smr/MutS family protein n=1 Tax=Prolixibacter sp. SD074 TaxID=2652391 RepID=UPI00127E6645|nr:DUF2027 domain-containing protein [Prolixibacter sp. SD074]GET28136.1 mannonate oxidoreductase [Prolixibacter sp. SD074]
MQIKIGDRVRFLNDVGGGKVTSIINPDMVNVETEDGFELPTLVTKLVVIGGGDTYGIPDKASEKNTAAHPATTTKATPEEDEEEETGPEFYGFAEINQVEGNNQPRFIFAVVPEDANNAVGAGITLYLINDCNYTVLYQFAYHRDQNYETRDSGTLEPNTRIQLEQLTQADLGDLPAFCFQLLYFRKHATSMEAPVQKEISLNPVKFYKQNSFSKNDYFRNPAMTFPLVTDPLTAELEKLSDKEFKKIVREKEKPPQKKMQPVSLPNQDLVEIDLHIQELLDNTSGLSNADMLKVQMDTFREEMAKAIDLGVKKIIFIHGVGNGVLKNELRRELQRKYRKYSFQDASFQEYGFGATMVNLKR